MSSPDPLELLALRHIGDSAVRAIGRRTAITTAFMAHALSQSMGIAVLTGTAIRLRTYVSHGVYRVIYYLVPLVVAIALLWISELRQRAHVAPARTLRA